MYDFQEKTKDSGTRWFNLTVAMLANMVCLTCHLMFHVFVHVGMYVCLCVRVERQLNIFTKIFFWSLEIEIEWNTASGKKLFLPCSKHLINFYLHLRLFVNLTPQLFIYRQTESMNSHEHICIYAVVNLTKIYFWSNKSINNLD